MMALLAGAGLVLAGCGAFGEDRQYACPRVFILGDAGSLVKFKDGPGRDITDTLFEAKIANFKGSCDYEDNGVEVSLQVQITVERGPAARDRKFAFDYFVAIPAFRPQPGGKQVFSVEGSFEDKRARLLYQDDVTMFIPLDRPTDGVRTDVVLGFQLSPSEVKFNRALRNR